MFVVMLINFLLIPLLATNNRPNLNKNPHFRFLRSFCSSVVFCLGLVVNFILGYCNGFLLWR